MKSNVSLETTGVRVTDSVVMFCNVMWRGPSPSGSHALRAVTHCLHESVDGHAQHTPQVRDSIWGSPLFHVTHFQWECDGVPP